MLGPYMPAAAFLWPVALALAEDDVEDEDELDEEDAGAVDVGAAVKTWPAKEVVKPDAVASVITGPPTEVTSTTGTPFAAAMSCQMVFFGEMNVAGYSLTRVAYAWEVEVPNTLEASERMADAERGRQHGPKYVCVT